MARGPQSLVFRVDAGAQVGLGHAMRCLALAQAWQDGGGAPLFVINPGIPDLEGRLKAESVEVVHQSGQVVDLEDAENTVYHARLAGASWVVVDGYSFNAEYQKHVKDAGLHVLFIDDYGHAGVYYADVVLNQNIYAQEQFYTRRAPHTHLLLGSRYTLLRREFWRWQRWQRVVSKRARKILVSLGGGDCSGGTLKVARALHEVGAAHDLEVLILIGAANPHYESLRHATEDSCFPLRIERWVSDMPALLEWADVAISAGGTTCWELAFMGLPALTIIMADNQLLVANALAEANVVRNLGRHETLERDDLVSALLSLLSDFPLRAEMSQRGRTLVDGKGAERVLSCLQAKTLN